MNEEEMVQGARKYIEETLRYIIVDFSGESPDTAGGIVCVDLEDVESTLERSKKYINKFVILKVTPLQINVIRAGELNE